MTLRRKPIRAISRRGTRFVASFEGFRSRPYKDAVGVWTIGYGHTAGVGPHTLPWTRLYARRVLRRELNARYAPFVASLGLPLTQPMFDALTSFVYNVGVGAIGLNTGVGRELRRHHWHHAADAMLKWNRAGGQILLGLQRRRIAERELFLSRLPKGSV